jgi:hypothetical protein
MRLPRMTTRRWMVAVAVAAVLMGASHLAWLNWVYQVAALTHGVEEEAADAAMNRKTAEYHAALRRKYEHAARYPWLPVKADPPESTE